MSSWTNRVYQASPLWLQQLGINAFGWYWARRRLGPEFERQSRAYAERESWPEDRFREYVERKLREQILRAYRDVPHYRQSFQQHGVAESVLERFTIEDLHRLPLLEKSAVRANPARLLTQQVAKNPPPSFATSGTTGTPLRVYWDAATHQHNIAVREARSFRWAGVSLRDPRSMIGGRLVVSKALSSPPYWRYNHWERQIYLSAFHISPANVGDYVAALNRFHPVTMTGYASANFFLARLIGEMGLEVHSPRAIITSSERLRPNMRAVLEFVFRTRTFEEYGSVENCTLATECERGGLHVSPDFGYLEILRPDGRPAKPGELGEVVLTGFANSNQIFIRYRIGDLASWSSRTCPCGRNTLPLLGELLGREEDTVVGPDGREVVRFHGLFVDLPGIVEGQLVQLAIDRFVVNVVTTSGYSQAEALTIRARMRERLGPDISVEIRELRDLPREPNGKWRAVISHVPRKPARPDSSSQSQLIHS